MGIYIWQFESFSFWKKITIYRVRTITTTQCTMALQVIPRPLTGPTTRGLLQESGLSEGAGPRFLLQKDFPQHSAAEIEIGQIERGYLLFPMWWGIFSVCRKWLFGGLKKIKSQLSILFPAIRWTRCSKKFLPLQLNWKYWIRYKNMFLMYDRAGRKLRRCFHDQNLSQKTQI